MVKLKQDWLVPAAVLVVAAVFLLYFGGFIGTVVPVGTPMTGSIAVMSLDNPMYSTDGSFFTRQWRAVTVLGVGGDTGLVAGDFKGNMSGVEGRPVGFDGKNLNLSSGDVVSKSFDIKYNLLSQSCNYEYAPGATTFYKYELVNSPGFSFKPPFLLGADYHVPSGRCVDDILFMPGNILYGGKNEMEAACRNVGGEIVRCSYQQVGLEFWGAKCMMVRKLTAQKFDAYTPLSPTREYLADIRITNEKGQTTNITHGSRDGVTKVGPIAVQRLVIGLGKDDCPTRDVVVIGSPTTTRVVDASSFYTLRNTMSPEQHVKSPSFESWKTTESQLSAVVFGYNSDVDTLAFITPAPHEFTVHPGDRTPSITRERLVLNWKRPIFFPIYITYIDADWVGIRQELSDPKITRVAMEPWGLVTDQSKSFGFTIWNNGSSGAVDVTVNCPTSMASVTAITPGPTGVVVNKNYEQNYLVTLRGVSSGSGTCTIRSCSAQAMNCDSRVVSLKVDKRADKPPHCIPPYYLWDGVVCTHLGCPAGYVLDPESTLCVIPEPDREGCHFSLPSNARWIDEDACDWECKKGFEWDAMEKACLEPVEEEEYPDDYLDPKSREKEDDNTIYFLIAGVLVVAAVAYFITQGKGGRRLSGRRRRR